MADTWEPSLAERAQGSLPPVDPKDGWVSADEHEQELEAHNKLVEQLRIEREARKAKN